MRIKHDLINTGFFMLAAAAVALLSGCVIAPPEIRLTGEKTLVENQIIGEYREIEDDAWTVSSVKTGVQRQQGARSLSGDDKFVEAMKIRELNAPLVRAYKNEGAVGESADGFLSYMKIDKYEKDHESRSALKTLIDDENRARRTVFERSLVSTGTANPSESDIAFMGRKFAVDEQTRSLVNDWIQVSNGKWQRKK